MPQPVSAHPARGGKADGNECAVGPWRWRPRRSSDSRRDCARRGGAHRFNGIVNHPPSRVSEVVTARGLQKRVERRRGASAFAAHSISDLICKGEPLPTRGDGNEHKCIALLNLASERALLLSSCKVILKWPFCCVFFFQCRQTKDGKTAYFIICSWSPA